MSLLNELRNWRNTQARIEGVEVYRVLSNTVLEALVGAMPANKEEMLAVKGIKEAKFGKYGAVLLRMIAEQTGSVGAKKNLEAKLPKQATNAMRSKNDDFFQSLVGTPSNLEAKPLSGETEKIEEGDQTLSVSQFLDGLNIELSGIDRKSVV